MSVASKTKTKIFTTVVLGFVAALSALPTWANTTPGTISLTTVSPVASTQPNQNLSELRTRLKDRFSGISVEVRSLIDGTTSPTDSFHGSAAIRTLDVSQGIGVKPAISRQDFFVDIENDPYKSYIIRLAAYDVLTPSQKFYPQNYFLVDDFTSLLSKLYKKTTGQSLASQDILSIKSADGIMTKGRLQKIMYSLNGIEKIDIDGNPYDKLMRSEGAYYLVRMFDLPTLNTDEETSITLGDVFTDIANHPFASEINTLASLGVLNTQTNTFYPDNYLRHYDFTLLFINALLTSKSSSLTNVSSASQFADVDSSASYLPQLNYAANHGLIDYITVSKRGALYFEPNSFITKHEVYQILSKALNIQFVYDEAKADQEKISRAELAKLLVDSFEFTPKINFQSDSSLLGNTLNTGDLSVLTKLKTLLSLL
ncbi:MAG: S-layer homology domain-containing protein [Candidatus Absconditabacterales bacterium]